MNSFWISHFDLIEGINRSFGRRVIERSGIDVSVRERRKKKLNVVSRKFRNRMDFVPLNFFILRNFFNMNVLSRDNSIRTRGGMG